VSAERNALASSESGGIQSVERAFAILREIASNPDGLRLVELGKNVGLRSSTTFHLVKTLVAMGYVGQIKGSKRYCIGRRLFTLAASALSEIGLVGIATPVLEELARATGECSQLAVRSDMNCLVVAKTSGTGIFQFVEQMGNLRPAYCTALGKVLISGLAPVQMKRYLEGLELRPFTARTLVDPEELQKEFDRVRQDGVAVDDGEFDADVRCVAVPVYDFTGQIAGAIGISGSVWRLSIQELQTKASQVREAGRALSAALGYSERT
jgi:IclR family transcriptional regulator, KDG regulon repressor